MTSIVLDSIESDAKRTDVGYSSSVEGGHDEWSYVRD